MNPRRSRLLVPPFALLLAGAAQYTAACGSSGNGATEQPDAHGPLADASLVNSNATGSPDASVPTDAPLSDAPSPLDDAGIVTRRPFPIVPNTSGKTLSSPTLVTIVASNDALATSLPPFSNAVPSSQLWSQVSAEYGLGTLQPTTPIVGPAIAAGTYTSGQIADFIATAIAGGAGPAPNGNTIYLIYLPDGATYAAPDTLACGYHAPYPNLGTTLGDQIATVRRCTPDSGGKTQLGQLTRTATHEIVEATTDPLDEGYNLGETPTTTPWTQSIWQSYALTGHVELGDLCEGTREFEPQDGGPDGGWEYQRIWSNAAALDGGVGPCIPQPSTPYFSTAVPNDWYPVSASGSLSIPVGGWTTGSTSDWLIKVTLDYAGGTGALAGIADGGGEITTSLGIQSDPGCNLRAGMNAGVHGTIDLPIPSGIPSGDFAVFKVLSFHEDPATCYPPLTEDDYHFWAFGVYAP